MSFRVRENEPPVIRFTTAPQEGELVQGESVLVRLSGEDPDDSIASYSVRLRGTDLQATASIGVFELFEISDGPQQLIAIAYDEKGAASEPIVRNFRFRYVERTPTPVPTESPSPSPSETPTPAPTESPSPTPASRFAVVETQIDGRTAITVTFPQGTQMHFIKIPGRRFTMGSTNGEADERPPVQNVAISPFWMGQSEVTLGQYREFVESRTLDPTRRKSSSEGPTYGLGENGAWVLRSDITWRSPSYSATFSSTDDHPVSLVSYQDACDFAEWLSENTNKNTPSSS